ncbi:MAG: ABC transporter ATP-binding protein [Candidatus Omnitrophota bacterium]|nr:ABC transporter ATP-binding protein [Candidatus Omnitrophota bacterium]MBU2034626.1 ABC transporter ATP-binding protein [Candidatus Omnitrophota bacterium]MBU2257686.1 ABC transporter ATP-binding protein [Candidatus Omnitrophota bacterium]
MLEAKNIHKFYNKSDKEVQVLRGLDLAIKKGEFTAIVGPSGAGKSTLLHILGGLDEPSQGSVVFQALDIYKMSDALICRIRNRDIGFVFQFYHLLPEFTVLENVMMPALIKSELREKSQEIKNKALELLDTAGLSERTGHFPSELSGGEQQRAAICRALINQPKILFCDEPTGNLDSKTGGEIISLINRTNKETGMTVVLVTHNLELANLSDKVYKLKDGILYN